MLSRLVDRSGGNYMARLIAPWELARDSTNRCTTLASMSQVSLLLIAAWFYFIFFKNFLISYILKGKISTIFYKRLCAYLWKKSSWWSKMYMAYLMLFIVYLYTFCHISIKIFVAHVSIWKRLSHIKNNILRVSKKCSSYITKMFNIH